MHEVGFLSKTLDLILLRRNPKERPNVLQLLNDPWILSLEEEPEKKNSLFGSIDGQFIQIQHPKPEGNSDRPFSSDKETKETGNFFVDGQSPMTEPDAKSVNQNEKEIITGRHLSPKSFKGSHQNSKDTPENLENFLEENPDVSFQELDSNKRYHNS